MWNTPVPPPTRPLQPKMRSRILRYESRLHVASDKFATTPCRLMLTRPFFAWVSTWANTPVSITCAEHHVYLRRQTLALHHATKPSGSIISCEH